MLVCLAIVLISSSGHAAHADADHAAIAKASLEHTSAQAMPQLAQSTDALKQSVAALCGKPSAAALKDTQEAFAATVEAWSVVEPIRFGPVAQEHRFERIFYWPDPKGLGTRQIRDVLAKQDKSVTEQTGLVGKSVALQGLPALEYLLYGDGAATLEKGGAEGTFRCSFAEAVAGNLAGMAKEIVDGWQDGAPYAKSYLEPGPANRGLSHGERGDARAVQDLHRRHRMGARPEIGKDAGREARAGKAAACPFWRSGLSFANMAGNLAGVRDLFAKGGFAQVVHQEFAGVEDSVVFDLDHAIEVLRGMDKPIAEAVRNEELRGKLEALRISLKAASTTAGDMISRGAGLTFGFNAMDGD